MFKKLIPAKREHTGNPGSTEIFRYKYKFSTVWIYIQKDYTKPVLREAGALSGHAGFYQDGSTIFFFRRFGSLLPEREKGFVRFVRLWGEV
jgi:hypothetical protein